MYRLTKMVDDEGMSVIEDGPSLGLTNAVHRIVENAKSALENKDMALLKQMCVELATFLNVAPRVVQAFFDLTNSAIRSGYVDGVAYLVRDYDVFFKGTQSIVLYTTSVSLLDDERGLECIKLLDRHGLGLSQSDAMDLVRTALRYDKRLSLEYVVLSFKLVWHLTGTDISYGISNGLDMLETVVRLATSVTWSDDGRECLTAACLGRPHCLRYLIATGATWNEEVCERVVIRAIAYDNVECLEFALDEYKEKGKNVSQVAAEIMENRTDWLNVLSMRSFDHYNDHEFQHHGLCDMAARLGHVDCLRMLHVEGGLSFSFRTLWLSSVSDVECFSYVLDTLDSSSDHHVGHAYEWEGAKGKLLIDRLLFERRSSVAVEAAKVLLSRRVLLHYLLSLPRSRRSQERLSNGYATAPPRLRKSLLRRIHAEIALPRYANVRKNDISSEEREVEFQACERATSLLARRVIFPFLRAVRRIEAAWLEYSYAPTVGRPGYERSQSDFRFHT